VGIQGVSSFANISTLTVKYTSQVETHTLLTQAAPPNNPQALREFYENNNIKSNASKGKINLGGSLGDALNKTQT
jgi:hypothetical protein